MCVGGGRETRGHSPHQPVQRAKPAPVDEEHDRVRRGDVNPRQLPSLAAPQEMPAVSGGQDQLPVQKRTPQAGNNHWEVCVYVSASRHGKEGAIAYDVQRARL